jgi:nucleoside-diphosphate-sugar epimerase
MGEPVRVTGAAGFIGFHLARRVAAEGGSVLRIDNLDDRAISRRFAARSWRRRRRSCIASILPLIPDGGRPRWLRMLNLY